jgi:DNA-binding NtrC family response regulator
LVVDDDKKIAELVAATLRLQGFEVSTATNGLHGYSTYSRNPTQWVVTDVEMPGLDGVAMVQCIRGIDPDVKVIYMTGAIDAHRALLEKKGREFLVDVLRKPFSQDSLVERMTTEQRRLAS